MYREPGSHTGFARNLERINHVQDDVLIVLWEHPTTITTSILLGQQTPRGQRQAVLYTAVRHSLPELQHRR
jgi:hypothetical protein